MATFGSSWRENLLSQLQNRNRLEINCFEELISEHNKLFENVSTLRSENLRLSVLSEKLRNENHNAGEGGSGDSRLHDKIQHLEKKLLLQQEELTELHRRKGENSQQIIDLNAKLQEKERTIASKDVCIAEKSARVCSLEAEVAMYQRAKTELESLNENLRDEHQALQLAFGSLEEKLRKAQDENRELVERLIKYKSKDADKMNEENDNFLNGLVKHVPKVLSSFGVARKRYARMQKEIEEACRDARAVSPEDLQEGYGPLTESIFPAEVNIKFDAHDGEVNAVKWSPADRLVATGGADRKVKLWEISKGVYENTGILVGSNAGVMAVDFDSSGSLILGASNDYASRVWTVADQRLRLPSPSIQDLYVDWWNIDSLERCISAASEVIFQPVSSKQRK